jgi:hypothetical protein
VPTSAWPYAIARGRLAGFQAIVVPDFLAEANEAYLLEYASRAEAGAGPGELIIRTVSGSVTGPVAIAYRVAEATADRYGLDGGMRLRDRSGRDIRVFEGLVLRVSAGHVRGLDITAADMDGVTALTAPAFRRLWAAADAIEADRSAAVSLGSGLPGSPVLGSYVTGPPARPQRRTRLLVAAAAAVLIAAGLSFAAWSLIAPRPPASPPSVRHQGTLALLGDNQTSYDLDSMAAGWDAATGTWISQNIQYVPSGGPRHQPTLEIASALESGVLLKGPDSHWTYQACAAARGASSYPPNPSVQAITAIDPGDGICVCTFASTRHKTDGGHLALLVVIARTRSELTLKITVWQQS